MIKVANAPCSWGILEFELEGQAADYVQVLDEMQQTGYLGTELGDWGFMPTDPELLESELRARSLEMLGAFLPVALSDPGSHAAGEEAAVRIANLLSATAGEKAFIVLADDNGKDPVRTKNAGRILSEHGLSEDQWASFAQGAERIAQKVLEQTGLRTVFHHHCAGFVETPEEVEKLLELTDPSLLGLCFDTGHYAFGGGDPVIGLRKHAERIWHVHFKDHEPRVHARSKKERWDYFRSVREGIFCELGKGDVDFTAIAGVLKTMNYRGWVVVEQDVLPGMGSPMESAQRNREYLKKIGL